MKKYRLTSEGRSVISLADKNKSEPLKRFIVRVPVFGVMEVLIETEVGKPNEELVMQAASDYIHRLAEDKVVFANGAQKVLITGVNEFYEGVDERL
jgi:hypothetical protein